MKRIPGCLLAGLISAVPILQSVAKAGTTSYTYDALGRLVAVVYSNGSPASYGYDPAGNIAQIVIGGAPVAKNAARIVVQNSSNNPIAIDVNGAFTSLAISTKPSHGTAIANGTSIRYTPAKGYSGQDSFQYTASNKAGTSSPATVTVAIS
jgi:YD repeat-containing protein